jgi:hypothetical protein
MKTPLGKGEGRGGGGQAAALAPNIGSCSIAVHRIEHG